MLARDFQLFNRCGVLHRVREWYCLARWTRIGSLKLMFWQNLTSRDLSLRRVLDGCCIHCDSPQFTVRKYLCPIYQISRNFRPGGQLERTYKWYGYMVDVTDANKPVAYPWCDKLQIHFGISRIVGLNRCSGFHQILHGQRGQPYICIWRGRMIFWLSSGRFDIWINNKITSSKSR